MPIGLQPYHLVPVVSTAPAYSVNDVVGSLLTLKALAPPPGIWLRRIIIADKDAQTQDFVLTIFDEAPTSIADNALITTLNDADPAKIIYEISLDNATFGRSYTANKIYRSFELDIPLISTRAGGDLSAFLWLSAGTPTYSTVSAIGIYLLTESWTP